MLFDLQSRNRRNVVRVIYLGLALLMGGGLILFGIGTGTGGGGLLDIFTGGGSSTSAQVSSAEKRANREVRLHPRDPQAWADLTRARYQTAGLGENYDQATNAFTSSGRDKLREAGTAWNRYLTLEPDHPDAALARLMAIAYSEVGIADPAEAASAMEIVTEDSPSASSFATLAQYAYAANELRKGDLAAGKAVELAPEAQKRLLRGQLHGLRAQLLRQRAELARGQGAAAPGG
jgi:hypothetical protein